MNEPIDFSIIVPTFNRPQQLGDLLRALAGLDYARNRWEVLIVDDGSTVSLEPTLAEWRDRLLLTLLKQSNQGPAAARNLGATHAHGQFLVFTDDDCVPTPDWLSVFAAALNAEPNRMVGGRVENALTDNVYSSASQLVTDLVYAYYNADLLSARFVASNNVALPADLFRALGGFDPSFRTSEDRDLCDRWLLAGYRLVYAPGAVIYHLHHLDLCSFWRQHLTYGFGAYHFNRAHARRHVTTSTLNPDFYIESLRRLPDLLSRITLRRAASLATLMIVWQIANSAGFVMQAFQTSFRNVFSAR